MTQPIERIVMTTTQQPIETFLQLQPHQQQKREKDVAKGCGGETRHELLVVEDRPSEEMGCMASAAAVAVAAAPYYSPPPPPPPPSSSASAPAPSSVVVDHHEPEKGGSDSIVAAASVERQHPQPTPSSVVVDHHEPEKGGSDSIVAAATAERQHPQPTPSSVVVDHHEPEKGGSDSIVAAATAERQHPQPILQQEEQHLHNKHDVIIEARVKVSEMRESSFFVSLPMLERRESEMKNTAESVSNDRWNGSRLHVMYYQQQHQNNPKKEESVKKNGQLQQKADDAAASPPQQTNTIVLRLDPAACLKERNLSHNFQWTEELTDMMQMYYKEGCLKVPALDDKDGGRKGMKGDHVLLALEYLGILYRPHQLRFGNASAYNEVKYWGLYLTSRDDLANHILSYIDESEAKQAPKNVNATGNGNGKEATSSNNTMQQHHQHQFAFCICPDGTDRNPKNRVPILATSRIPSSRVFDFFDSNSAAGDMRNDFCSYLPLMAKLKMQKQRMGHHHNNNNNLHVKFIEPNSAPHCHYWIISIRRSSSSSSVVGGGTSILTGITSTTSSSSNVLLNKDHHKESLPYPLDEMVEEELKQGTLERLIEEAQERTTQKKIKERRQHSIHKYNKVRSSTSPSPSSYLSGTSPRHVTEYPHHINAVSKNDDDFQELLQVTAPPAPASTAAVRVPAHASNANNCRKLSCNAHQAQKPPTPPQPSPNNSTSPATDDAAATAEMSEAAVKHKQKQSTAQRRAATSTVPPAAATSSPSPITVADDNTAAPVRVVRASVSEQSVTSALSGPFFYETEEDDELSSDAIVQTPPKSSLRSPTTTSSPRRYRAWIQNNKSKTRSKSVKGGGGISTRVRALLDDATDLDDVTTSLSPLSEGEAEGDGTDSLSWEWISDAICHFPRTLLHESTMAKEPPLMEDISTMEEDFNAVKLCQKNACGADDVEQQQQPKEELPGPEKEGHLKTKVFEQQALSPSKPEMRLKYRDLVVLEESDVPISSAGRRRTLARQRTSTTTAATTGKESPHFVKDRLQAIQQQAAQHQLRQRRRNETHSLSRGRQGIDVGPEKEVILSKMSPLQDSESPESADSLTANTTDESGPEYYAISKPKSALRIKKKIGNLRKVRFHLFGRGNKSSSRK